MYSEDIARSAAWPTGSPVPIAAGERLTQPFQFDDLGRRGHVGIWQPETLAIGGVSGVRRIAALAATHGAVHRAAQRPRSGLHRGERGARSVAAGAPDARDLRVRCGPARPRRSRRILPEVVDGYVRPTDRPGIGIEHRRGRPPGRIRSIGTTCCGSSSRVGSRAVGCDVLGEQCRDDTSEATVMVTGNERRRYGVRASGTPWPSSWLCVAIVAACSGGVTRRGVRRRRSRRRRSRRASSAAASAAPASPSAAPARSR